MQAKLPLDNCPFLKYCDIFSCFIEAFQTHTLTRVDIAGGMGAMPHQMLRLATSQSRLAGSELAETETCPRYPVSPMVPWHQWSAYIEATEEDRSCMFVENLVLNPFQIKKACLSSPRDKILWVWFPSLVTPKTKNGTLCPPAWHSASKVQMWGLNRQPVECSRDCLWSLTTSGGRSCAESRFCPLGVRNFCQL